MKQWFMMLLLVSGVAHAIGGETHGDEVFEVGGATQVFDVMEHENEFVPTELPEYASLLAPQLAILKRKLPRTGRYLEKVFIRGIKPRWYFVKAKLKETKDEGPSNLVLSYQKSQIAVNSGRVVQIQRALFDKLEARHKAYLLMHEATISAIGVGLVHDGNQIRSLAALFMHKKLGDFSAKEIGDEIRGIVPESTSKLRLLASMDTNGSASLLKKDTFEDDSTLEDGATPTSCEESSDHCVFREVASGVYWTKDFRAALGGKSWKDANDYCTKLKGYAGFSDWRLPARSELRDLAADAPDRVYDAYPEWGALGGAVWSSNVVPDNVDRAFGTNLQFGSETNYDRATARLGVRCVRNDIDPLWEDVSVNAEGTYYTTCRQTSDHCAFKQKSTGLIWTAWLPKHRLDATTSQSYDEAVGGCAGLGNWAAHVGWGVPTMGQWQRAIREGFPAYTRRFSREGFGIDGLSAKFWGVGERDNVATVYSWGSWYTRAIIDPRTGKQEDAADFYSNKGPAESHGVRAAWLCVTAQ